jgi:GTP-binding protein HflX
VPSRGPQATASPAAAPDPEEPTIRVFGNTQGLKASQVRQLERLARRKLPADRIVTHELARELAALSHETGRLVGILVDRRGAVTHVMAGDSGSIVLPDWGRMRAGRGRLRGLRCIHTRFDGDPPSRDDLTDLARLRLDAMLVVEVLEDGLPGLVRAAALLPANDAGGQVQHLEAAPASLLDFDFQAWVRALEDELARRTPVHAVGAGERAILVCVTGGRRLEEFEYAQEELQELARSANVSVAEVLTQHRPRVDPRTVIGEGKLQDLTVRCIQSDVDLVIFDDNLSPAQARNLAERLDLRVIDRTQLILDIFAQHARTRDGKLQVELAQLRYVLPRLAQRDTSLSRLAGGIGGRGPGEQKLEMDRRRVRDRITRLARECKLLERQRAARRARRDRRSVPVLSIVGYTNAGKSTLLRSLTRTPAHVEDKMFATLDPASRRLRFPREREVIVTDTVGFIRDLPPELVAAFHATLEELREADLFLHVVDGSAGDLERRIAAVRRVLDEMGLEGTPELLVFNKIDRLPAGEGEALARSLGGVAVSALERRGLRELLGRAERELWRTETDGRRSLLDEEPVVRGEVA